MAEGITGLIKNGRIGRNNRTGKIVGPERTDGKEIREEALWGTEYSAEMEAVQMSTGREYINAGADIVIGAHPTACRG